MLNFDYKVDTSELLKDKSCCPWLSKWSTEFDRRYYKVRHGSNPPKLEGSQKRVILKYLNLEEVDCESIIRRFVTVLPREFMIDIRTWKENEVSEEKNKRIYKISV